MSAMPPWPQVRLMMTSLNSGRRRAAFAITALNEALLEGDSRDILVLRNVSGSAPHLRL